MVKMKIARNISASVLRPYSRKPKTAQYLQHYGVKGMKWGVRRTPEELGHDKNSIKARMNHRLKTPMKAANGVVIKRFSEHALERTQLNSRPVTVEDILDALQNPLNCDSIKTKIDGKGQVSQQLIGKWATVVVNPETGTIVTTWCTGTRARNKYRRR